MRQTAYTDPMSWYLDNICASVLSKRLCNILLIHFHVGLPPEAHSYPASARFLSPAIRSAPEAVPPHNALLPASKYSEYPAHSFPPDVSVPYAEMC